MHKYELEIRAHVKMEQEFRKIAEESERKQESLKTEFNALSVKYNKMIDKLSSMAYENESLCAEVNNLRSFLADHDRAEKDSDKKGQHARLGSGVKERSVNKQPAPAKPASKGHTSKVRSVSSADGRRQQLHIPPPSEVRLQQLDEPGSETRQNKLGHQTARQT